MKNKLKVAGIIAISALPLLALAQPTFQGPPNTTGIAPTTVAGWFTLFENIVGWIQKAFWILAIVFILVAAFKYLTAAGDPEKVKSASHVLLYAVIAIVVAIVAFALPALIANFISTNGA